MRASLPAALGSNPASVDFSLLLRLWTVEIEPI